MHIPDQMLQGAVCPVTMAIALGGVTTAVAAAAKSGKRPDALRFAAVTALIFAGQMLNFPVTAGTSGHLLGGVLAVALLGAPFAVLAMTLVLTVQTLLFGDGGLWALGANVINMALVGVAVGALFKGLMGRRETISLVQRGLLFGLAGWLAVMFAALGASLELAASGAAAFGTVAPAMLGIHAWIGLGEALITGSVFLLLASSQKSPAIVRRNMALTFVLACGGALFLSPLASSFPDGLEMVAEAFGFLPQDGGAPFAPLAGYQLPGIGSAAWATGLAGLLGVLATSGSALLFALRLGGGSGESCP